MSLQQALWVISRLSVKRVVFALDFLGENLLPLLGGVVLNTDGNVAVPAADGLAKRGGELFRCKLFLFLRASF